MGINCDAIPALPLVTAWSWRPLQGTECDPGQERVTGEGEERGRAMGNRAQEQLVTCRLAILATLSSSVGIILSAAIVFTRRVCTHAFRAHMCVCMYVCVC